MIKRANAQKAMGFEALSQMKHILGWAKKSRKSVEDVVRMFDGQGKGYVTHGDIFSAYHTMGFTDQEKVKDAVNALDPTSSNCIDAVDFGKMLRKAEGEINLQKVEERRKAIWDERFREAEKVALAEQSRQEESFTREELAMVIKFMDPDNSDSIDLEEFINGFRKARRSKASQNVHAEGRE